MARVVFVLLLGVALGAPPSALTSEPPQKPITTPTPSLQRFNGRFMQFDYPGGMWTVDDLGDLNVEAVGLRLAGATVGVSVSRIRMPDEVPDDQLSRLMAFEADRFSRRFQLPGIALGRSEVQTAIGGAEAFGYRFRAMCGGDSIEICGIGAVLNRHLVAIVSAGPDSLATHVARTVDWIRLTIVVP